MKTKYAKRINNKKVMKEESKKIEQFVEGVSQFKEEIEPHLPKKEIESVEERVKTLKKEIETFRGRIG